MEYQLKVKSVQDNSVTLETSMGYIETLKVGDHITIELPDDANVEEVSSTLDLQVTQSYEDLKQMAKNYRASQAQDAVVQDSD